MADENLTEGELDELLKDVELTEEQKNVQVQEQSLQGVQVKAFNLGTQERLVRGRMPTIETVHERFIRLFRITASNLFGQLVEVKTTATTTCKYGELLARHSQPSNINLIKLKPLRGTGLLIMDPNLVLYTVDNLFGGGARFPVSIEGREFTATEMRIVSTLLKTFFGSYKEAWAPAYPLECEHVSSEMNLSFVNVAMASELMSTTTFTIVIGETNYEIELCVPYMTLEPIMDVLTSQTQGMVSEHDHIWELSLLEQVQAVEVEVVANLGNKTMLMEEIIALKNGDVIPLSYLAEIPVTVDNVPVLSCRYGIYNNQYSLRVEKLLKPDASEYIKGANDGK
ncbi:flagellar motor switch protein FliM [Polynucleobacter sp. UB-Raua-W9]|uniref:flagellar motor switch protein FliM n=1 Tax=Polynucleobacter sp. UB-Raua-W9 TaxID=1819736 RepID=UPI001BFD1742|nr:flagellar motor switch protein FliM [Polynucleobacter sp. UB-Raua-W9]QWD71800.1 flagellar motor switch protein FliM [Polynucleobacter sp. UB-Raua-W9]